MSILKIAICDDDALDMRSEEELINQIMPDFAEKYSIDTFNDAKMLLKSDNNYHMVFLDVEMTGLNGIRTAEEIHSRNKDCLIFFVTNHEDYMDEALNKHAFRFWTKPINRARLIYGIKSAILEIESKQKNINVLVGSGKIKLSAHEIIYVFHQDRRTHIVTINREIKTYDTYKSIAEQLNQSYFFETDKSCIVNLNYVLNYTRGDIICVYGSDEYKAPLSRRRYKGFDERFHAWGGEKQ